jgi:hypothetical protein
LPRANVDYDTERKEKFLLRPEPIDTRHIVVVLPTALFNGLTPSIAAEAAFVFLEKHGKLLRNSLSPLMYFHKRDLPKHFIDSKSINDDVKKN